MNFKDEHGDLSMSKVGKTALAGVFGLAVVGAGFGSFFVTSEGQVDMIKTMGKLDESKVYTAGPHLKMPFADSVSTFSIAPKQKTYEKLDTNTGDNQPITGTINITYNVPTEAVPRLIRDPNWESRIEPQAVSSFKEVMGKQDAVSIAINREKINKELTQALKASLGREVGVIVTNVQLVNYDLEKGFMTTINQVAQSKALAEKSKQDQVKTRIDAENSKIEAEGKAAAAFAKAEGEAKAIRTTADADAYATGVKGKTEAEAMRTKISAVGDPKILVDLAYADAWKTTGGKVPETMVNGGGSTTLLSPATKAVTAAIAPKPPTP